MDMSDLPTIRFTYRSARAYALLQYGFELRRPNRAEKVEAAARWTTNFPYMCVFLDGQLYNAWQRAAWKTLISRQDWRMFVSAFGGDKPHG